MQFAESFDHDADDVMEEVLADAGMSPTLTPFVSLGTEHSGLGDVPATPWQASAKDLFQSFDNGEPSVERMRRIGLHHDEAFEL